MAKKKRKPRNRQTGSRPSPSQGATATDTAPRAAPARGGANPARRAHKEEARRAREAARRRQTRVSIVRRAITIGVISLVAVGTLWFLQRAGSPGEISAEAVAAAQAAGCTEVEKPSDDPIGGHLDPGESISYPDHPATSGRHDPSPLGTSPAVYTEPVTEAQAVHFLEHSGVIIYYRADGDGALDQDTIDALGTVAEDQRNTLLAPYPNLDEGTSLALTAWNRLQTCPGTVTATQASTIANGFATAFVCTSVGPEPKASDDC